MRVRAGAPVLAQRVVTIDQKVIPAFEKTWQQIGCASLHDRVVHHIAHERLGADDLGVHVPIGRLPTHHQLAAAPSDFLGRHRAFGRNHPAAHD